MMTPTLLTDDLYDRLYHDLCEFRSTFDLPNHDGIALTAQEDTLHTSLIIEELTELVVAGNKLEQADAIIDSIYVLMGRLVDIGVQRLEECPGIAYLIDLLLHTAKNLSINFLACWDEIHSSNMSKACRNWQEYKDTEAYYHQKGISITAVEKEDGIIAKCAADHITAEKTILKGKVLKSVYYRPADLSPLL